MIPHCFSVRIGGELPVIDVHMFYFKECSVVALHFMLHAGDKTNNHAEE